MSEKIIVKITDPEHLMDFGQWVGYASALEKLRKGKWEKLPGYALAVAKLEAMEANLRASNAGRNLRLAMKAGHDLSLYNVLWRGLDEIELEPIDLEKEAPAPESPTV